MSTTEDTVVVTGLGATTPLGGDVRTTWQGLLAGRSGARALPDTWPQDLPVRFAATAVADPAEIVGRVTARRMDRWQLFALVAAREAWQDAGAPEVDPTRLGVVVCPGLGGISSILASYETYQTQGWRRVSPYTIPSVMGNGAAGWISMEFGAQAGAHAPISACASGAEAIGYAIDMIRSGRADVVLAGAGEAFILPVAIASFAAMRAMSQRNDDPEGASRPFDKGRDGFVIGEGGGVIVLESAAHARRRGARVYAVAAGAGYSADAHHISAPSGVGARAAMRFALDAARVKIDDVVHVNAHATSTPAGDVVEAAALAEVFGAGKVVVSATKSMTGHLLGATGAVESIATILALAEKVAPPTINLDDPEDDLPIDVATEPRELRSRTGAPLAAVNNSFGFGGHNVSLVFTAP
ncbi:beta-ketoacyl-ACP synthase II [Streptosporangiaceae bacterium NEAU-GS5]|nr:beta-ketoacyl-ACP synthase II [Streptosporangiaceae bacterium NEAU-GS5]